MPPKNGLLIESFSRILKGKKNYYIVAYTFQGRNINQTLGILILKKLEENGSKPLAFVATDYALAVWSIEKCKDIYTLFSYEGVNKNLRLLLDNTSFLKKHFRNTATIAGLIDKKLPGHNKTGKQITFNSDLIYEVLTKYEKNHILLESSKNEAFNELVDYERLSNFLKKIRNKIILKELTRISPLAVPLIIEFNTESVDKNNLIKYEYENSENQILKEAKIKNEDNF